MCAHAMTFEEVRRQFSVFSSLLLTFGDGTQVISFGGKRSYAVSHLTGYFTFSQPMMICFQTEPIKLLQIFKTTYACNLLRREFRRMFQEKQNSYSVPTNSPFPKQKWNNVLCLLPVLSEGHLSYYLDAHQEKVVSGFHSKAFDLNYPILIRYKINAMHLTFLYVFQ